MGSCMLGARQVGPPHSSTLAGCRYVEHPSLAAILSSSFSLYWIRLPLSPPSSCCSSPPLPPLWLVCLVFAGSWPPRARCSPWLLFPPAFFFSPFCSLFFLSSALFFLPLSVFCLFSAFCF